MHLVRGAIYNVAEYWGMGVWIDAFWGSQINSSIVVLWKQWVLGWKIWNWDSTQFYMKPI